MEGGPALTVSPSRLASCVSWSQGSSGCPWPAQSRAVRSKCFSVSPFLGLVLGSPIVPHSTSNEGDLVNRIQPAGEDPFLAWGSVLLSPGTSLSVGIRRPSGTFRGFVWSLVSSLSRSSICAAGQPVGFQGPMYLSGRV